MKEISKDYLALSKEPQGFVSQMEESFEHSSPGSLDETNNSKAVSDANGLFSTPVAAGEIGEGLPYAPDGWPNPGDKWVWKIKGRRKSRSGYWADRYLYPPKHLQMAMGSGKKGLSSKLQIRAYLGEKFPDADIDAFFSSFQWKIPYKDLADREASDLVGRAKKKRARNSNPSFDSREQQTKTRDESSVPGMQIHVDISSDIEEEVPANVTPKTANMLVKCAGNGESSDHRQIPVAIQEALTTAASLVLKKLKSLPLEFLGENMKYFNNHVEWFVNHNFPVEEFERELNLRFKAYQEKQNRRREIDACLNRIEETICTLEQEMVDLRRQADELRREQKRLFG